MRKPGKPCRCHHMTFTASAGVGVRAADGKLMFRYPTGGQQDGERRDADLFEQQGVLQRPPYGTGGGLLDLTAQNGEVTAKEVYFTREMRNHHGGVVLVDGYIYGFNDTILTCLEFATGKMMWRDRILLARGP